MIKIRKVKIGDLSVVAEMMYNALEPFYGGDHRAHAKRIVETATHGTKDKNGHFSAAQLFYVAEKNNEIIGILNFVVKHQGTLKISPLIIREDARGKGVSRLLLRKMETYAKKYCVRQIYCTVSAKNKLALGYFLARGFVRAGTAIGHYRTNIDEVLLYKITGYGDHSFEENIISVLPLAEEDKPQVRQLVISSLSLFFEGVNDKWVDSLFAGHERKDSRDPNEKYKLIWVAKSGSRVLGVASATPKKGEPIKLMPLVAENIQAFSSLMSEISFFSLEYGHKLYTHIVPNCDEVKILQQHGWQIEAMMPEAYKRGVVTEQWGLVLGEKIMKTMRMKQQYFDAIMAGTKSLEVRVGYASIQKIRKGDNIRLECGRLSGIVQVSDVRIYQTFAEMLKCEKSGHIVPEDPAGALRILQGIYPREKEELGIYVFEIKVVKSTGDR